MSFEKIEYSPYDTLGAEQVNAMQDELLRLSTAGGALDLLWENASPDSTFAAQTVSVADIGNTEKYSHLFIDFNLRTFVVANKVGGGGVDMMTISAKPYFYARPISLAIDSVEFGTCKYKEDITSGSTSTKNDVLIPTAIYGIKGVSSNV